MMKIWEDNYVYCDLSIILCVYVLKHQTELLQIGTIFAFCLLV